MVEKRIIKSTFAAVCGIGIPRIMGLYKDNITQPKIEISTNVFKITLPIIENEGTDSAEARAVLKLFENMGLNARSDVKSAIGVPRSRAGAILSGLVSDGRLKVVGTGRNTKYKLS